MTIRTRTAAAWLAAALTLAGCSSDDATNDADPAAERADAGVEGNTPTADTTDGTVDGEASPGFDDIVGTETGGCFSLALTASQIPIVSSGPDASESDLDDSIATLDGVLPEELLDELATMAAMARDALTMSDAEATSLFESAEYTEAATPVVDHLNDSCE